MRRVVLRVEIEERRVLMVLELEGRLEEQEEEEEGEIVRPTDLLPRLG